MSLPIVHGESSDNESHSKNNESFNLSVSSTSSQYSAPSNLPQGHRLCFLENGRVNGCQWVLLYNNNMYGNYLVPKALLDGPVLTKVIENHRGIIVPESIKFACDFIEAEKLNRHWSCYIPLCLTYFISDMLRVSYLIEDPPKTVHANLMTHVLISYFFVDYLMTRKAWLEYAQVKKELTKYQAVWQSNEAESISEQFMCCSTYIIDNFGVTSHPDSMTPAIYPWDFVDYFKPYITEIETGKNKSEGMNYPS